MVEKTVNVKSKANLQPLSETSKINSNCSKGYRPSVKKNNDDVNQEYQNEAPKNKAKSHNSSFANQPQTQALKKNKRKSRRRGHPTTGVNATEVAKIDKAKDMSYIECYTYKQKGHYAYNSPKKPKN